MKDNVLTSWTGISGNVTDIPTLLVPYAGFAVRVEEFQGAGVGFGVDDVWDVARAFVNAGGIAVFPFFVWEEMLEPCYTDDSRVGFLWGFLCYVRSCSWSGQ